jgi:protein O-GlcNAc transferase
MPNDGPGRALALGYAAESAGDLRAAIAHYRAAEKQFPHVADPSIALFAAARRAGDLPLALTAGRRAVEKAPADLDLLAGFGHTLAQAGESERSLAIFAQAAAAGPDNVGALINYANALTDAKRAMEALDVAARAGACAPASAAPFLSKAQAELALGAVESAIASLEAARNREPDAPDICVSLATALRRAGRWADAVAAIRTAIVRVPDFAPAHLTLGNLLYDLGDMQEAAAAFRRAVDLGHAAGRVNLVHALNNDPPADPLAVKAAHVDLAHTLERQPASALKRRAVDGGVLRVGFVSPDLHTHSVPYFLESWLGHIDAKRIATFAYSDSQTPDATTARLRALFANWHNSRRSNDSDLAARIARDGIDIAIDLAGHTRFNRLAAFAQRLAPVQVSWIGYPATTGLQAMDWRFTDAVADPVGGADAHGTERLFRLPHFLCYAPPADAAEAERIGNGRLTFGSFNNAAKLSAATLDAWAEILRRVPGSDLLLKAKTLENGDAAARLRACFADRGVAPERLHLTGHAASRNDHLALYSAVDIALDPFGYNGTTTTCEALWMGVPVVTLAGDRHAARVGASLMAAAGLPEFVASDREGYIALAVAMAGEPARRDRAQVRAHLAASALLDGKRMAADLADALHAIWRMERN